MVMVAVLETLLEAELHQGFLLLDLLEVELSCFVSFTA
jgi:hypothetical protein